MTALIATAVRTSTRAVSWKDSRDDSSQGAPGDFVVRLSVLGAQQPVSGAYLEDLRFSRR
jgi:hypothetical protein